MIQAAVQQRLSDRTTEEQPVWRNEFSTVFPAASLHNTSYTNISRLTTEKRQPMLALDCSLGAPSPNAQPIGADAPLDDYFLAGCAVNSPSRTRASDATACVLGSLASVDQSWRALAVSPASP